MQKLRGTPAGKACSRGNVFGGGFRFNPQGMGKHQF
jgi:hypothetical protein